MKYVEKIAFLETSNCVQSRKKQLLKKLLPTCIPILQEIKNKISKNKDDVYSLHEELDEVRSMYRSLSTILITSSLYYVGKNKEDHYRSYDHWDLVPDIANILGFILDDVFYFHDTLLNEDLNIETEEEKNHRINVMRLLTWGLNTGVYKHHPNRLEGYENGFWGIPLTEEEREDLWATGWKKHIPKVKASSLIEVMNQQKKELELPKNDLTSIKRNTFIKEEKDWGRFRRG
jgi:hypothetical protein